MLKEQNLDFLYIVKERFGEGIFEEGGVEVFCRACCDRDAENGAYLGCL